VLSKLPRSKSWH